MYSVMRVWGPEMAGTIFQNRTEHSQSRNRGQQDAAS